MTDVPVPPSSGSGFGPEVAPGQVIAGKYRVDGVLGVGGMGVIFAGKHLQLDQKVAIKVLKRDALGDPEFVARFQREARASVKIPGEHVARVLDVGALPNGTPFMVMEFLRGSDLAQVMKANGKLGIDVALEYVLQACEAVAEAHKAGIVHRDLKPANLFLTKRADGSPLVKVLDFGISKFIGKLDDSGRAEPLTQTSMMMGSPHYMPPEQLKSARRVDARADIWSLGVMLHKLITGEHAFDAESQAELCVQILTGEPRRLREQFPEAPEALEAALLKCTRKEPADRFASVGDLANALLPFTNERGAASVARIIAIEARAVSVSPSDAAPPVDGDGSTSIDISIPRATDVASISTMAASVASTESLKRNAGLPRRRTSIILGVLLALLGGGALFVVFAPRVLTPSTTSNTVSGATPGPSETIAPHDTASSVPSESPLAPASPPAAPNATGAAPITRPSASVTTTKPVAPPTQPQVAVTGARTSRPPPSAPSVSTQPAPAPSPVDPTGFGGRK